MLASKSPLYPTKQTLTRKISFGIGASIPANEPARGGRVVRVLLQQVVHLQRHFRYGSWVVGADGLVEAARRISPFHYTCGNKQCKISLQINKSLHRRVYQKTDKPRSQHFTTIKCLSRNHRRWVRYFRRSSPPGQKQVSKTKRCAVVTPPKVQFQPKDDPQKGAAQGHILGDGRWKRPSAPRRPSAAEYSPGRQNNKQKGRPSWQRLERHRRRSVTADLPVYSARTVSEGGFAFFSGRITA